MHDLYARFSHLSRTPIQVMMMGAFVAIDAANKECVVYAPGCSSHCVVMRTWSATYRRGMRGGRAAMASARAASGDGVHRPDDVADAADAHVIPP